MVIVSVVADATKYLFRIRNRGLKATARVITTLGVEERRREPKQPNRQGMEMLSVAERRMTLARPFKAGR
ncbi:MAG: hypothetical protein ACXW18_03010 [Pyrinomonadaceae bacterium]